MYVYCTNYIKCNIIIITFRGTPDRINHPPSHTHIRPREEGEMKGRWEDVAEGQCGREAMNAGGEEQESHKHCHTVPAQYLHQCNILNSTRHHHNICTNTTSVVVVVGCQWRMGRGGGNGGGEQDSQKHNRTSTTSLAAQYPQLHNKT